MSFLRYMTLYSLRKLNPDFTINLVVPKQKSDRIERKGLEVQDEVYFDGEDYTDRIKDLSVNIFDIDEILGDIKPSAFRNIQKSDILGWKILAERGGVRADNDILFHRPIPYEEFKDVDVSLFEYHNICPCGFLYGSPNVFWEDVLNEALRHTSENGDQATGPLPLTFVAKQAQSEKYKHLKIVRPNNELIYPYVNIYSDWGKNCLCAFEENLPLPPENIGIHWYGGFPVSAHYNNILTEKNYTQYNSTVCNTIKKLLND